MHSRFEKQLASLSWRKCATCVSQFMIPTWWQRTSFLLRLTFVSSKYYLATRAWMSFANSSFPTFLSPLAHCFPFSFASNNYLLWKALLSAFLLRPTQLLTTLKPVLDDVEMTIASTTFWATNMSFLHHTSNPS